METRITSRVIIYQDNKILLSRNQGLDYWYPGGGGWKYGEDLLECCIREVKEETNLDIDVMDLIYVQEFYSPQKKTRNLELFFLAYPKTGAQHNQFHHDQDTDNRLLVEENKWFSEQDITKIKDKIFPQFIRDQFWQDIKRFDYHKKTYYKEIEQ